MNAEGDGRAATDAGRPLLSPADVLAGLGASFAWATFTFIGLGDGRSGAAALVALGFASSSAVPLVVLVRLFGWTRSVPGPIEAAALVVLVPVALFASAIQTHTHHRALGAVTFAVGATLMFGVALLVARRVLREAATGGRLWRILGVALRGASFVSLSWILWTLIGSSHRERTHAAMVDGMLGLVAVALFARAPRAWFPSLLVRVAPALFATFLGAGVVAAWKNAPSFALICERAPVTSGILGVFACH